MASSDIRMATRMLLHERIERRSGVNAGPAANALMASVVSVGVVVSGVFLTVFDNLVGTMGSANGPTAGEFSQGMGYTVGPVIWILIALVIGAILALARAKAHDRERSMAAAWLSVYTDQPD